MIRIRPGDSWRHDPSCLADLRALATGRNKGFSLRNLVDAIRIEVEGVDLTKGRAEVPLLDALQELGAARDGHPIELGSVTLRVEPMGDEVRLHVVTPPRTVLAMVDAHDWADAVTEAAEAFVAALAAVHPALEQHRLCAQLLGKPASPPPRTPKAPKPRATTRKPPLGPRLLASPPPRLSLPDDGLRRMLFRRQWRDTVAIRTEVFPFGGAWLLRHPKSVEGRAVDGQRLWSHRLTHAHVETSRHPWVIGFDPTGQLIGVDAKGEAVFRARVRKPAALAGWHRWPDGRFALVTAHSVEGTDWHWSTAPDETTKSVLATGGHVLVATNHRLLAFDTTGRIAWTRSDRHRPVKLLRLPRDRVVLVERSTLVCLSELDGTEFWRVAWPHRVISDALAVGAHLCLGLDGDAPTIALLTSHGVVQWERRVEGEGHVHPRWAQGAFWVARRGAGLRAFDLNGRDLPPIAPLDPDPTLAPAEPAPVQISGRLGLLSATRLHVVDLRSGRPLAALEGTELTPHSAAILPNGRVALVGSDGEVEAWAPSGYLRVPLDSATARPGRNQMTGA